MKYNFGELPECIDEETRKLIEDSDSMMAESLDFADAYREPSKGPTVDVRPIEHWEYPAQIGHR
jgi:hypothetical protein